MNIVNKINRIAFIFSIFLFLILNINAEKRYCGDPKCETIISDGTTTSKYFPPTKNHIQLNINSVVTIYSKPVNGDGRHDLWDVGSQGRRGLAPSRFIRERKIIKKKQDLIIVDTDELKKDKVTDEKGKETEIKGSLEQQQTVETNTTAPLPADNIPKDIIKEATNNNVLDSNSISSTVKHEVVDGTNIPIEVTEKKNEEDMDDDQDDEYVEDDKDIDDEEGDDEGDDDISVDRDKFLEAETKKSKEADESGEQLDLTQQKKIQEITDSEKNEQEKMDEESKNPNLDSNKEEIKINNLQKTEDEIILNTDNQDQSQDIVNDTKIEQTNSSEVDMKNEVKPNLSKEVDESENQNSNSENNEKNQHTIQKRELLSEEEKAENVTLSENIENESETKETVNVKESDEISLLQEVNKKADELFEENLNVEEKKEEKNVEVIPKENESIQLEVKTSGENTDNNNNNSNNNIIKQDSAKVDGENNDNNSKNQENQEHHGHHDHEDHHHHHHHHHDHLPLFFNGRNLNKETVEKTEPTLPNTLEKVTTTEATNELDNDSSNKIENSDSIHGTESSYSAEFDENVIHSPLEDVNLNTLEKSVTKEDVVIPEKHIEISETEKTELEKEKLESVENVVTPENSVEMKEKNEKSDATMKQEDSSSHYDEPLPLSQNIIDYPDQPTENEEKKNFFSTSMDFISSYTNLIVEELSGLWTTKNENENLESENIEAFVSKNIPENIIQESAFDKVVPKEYCEKIGPNNNCPLIGSSSSSSSFTESDFFTSMSDKILEMFDMLVLLSISAVSAIIFAFGYYCISNSRKENFLINKLNIVERNLLAANKEVTILKQDLQDSASKILNIEDSSLDNNKIVKELKKQLKESEQENKVLKQEITSLQEDLHNASSVESELKNSFVILSEKEKEQESLNIIIEELKKEIVSQQDVINEMNDTIAEKRRENSELHIAIAERSEKSENEIMELHTKIQSLENENLTIKLKLEETEIEIRETFMENLTSKDKQIETLETELKLSKQDVNDLQRKLQLSESKIESLKECLQKMNQESWADIDDLIDTVDIKADNLLLEKEISTLKESLEAQQVSRSSIESQIKELTQEVSNLRKDKNQAEKDKLEAQTRLDVLSNYFKEKEAQLQKELTMKEALWMKQQGETTSTVERIRSLQTEMEALKSQNEALHAEIEAQTSTHKTQLAALETQAHEAWLLAKQSDRKYEEARSESAILRRKLTTLMTTSNNNNTSSGNNSSSTNDLSRPQHTVTDGVNNTNANSSHSLNHLDTANSPTLIPGALPPPPPFLPPPPPFMHHIPGPFMGIHAPFGLPPGGRPPPLGGRIVSPPPQHRRVGRYSPSLIDDDDFDYDEDYDYEDDERRPRSSRHNRNHSPENGRYSPDSRYNYTTDVMSQYDTETDFSPRDDSFLRGRRGGSINRDIRHNDRSTPLERTNSSNSKIFRPLSPSTPKKNHQQLNNSDRGSNKSNKGKLSSGSEKSFNSRVSKGKVRV